MTLQIDPVSSLIVVIGCFVFYVVYVRSSRRDLVGAITSAAAVSAVLAVLFGAGADDAPPAEIPRPVPTAEPTPGAPGH